MAEAKKAVIQEKPRYIQAVYGRMVDPHTGLEFNVVPSELFKLTPWVQSQLDTGKLKLVLKEAEAPKD